MVDTAYDVFTLYAGEKKAFSISKKHWDETLNEREVMSESETCTDLTAGAVVSALLRPQSNTQD